MTPDLSRVIVIGTSGCGKTVLSRQLSKILGHPHIEFDALFWLPNWVMRPQEEFCKLVEEAVSGDHWIVDGNYGNIREMTTTWPRATTVIWLNYSLATVFGRVLYRTIRRSLSGEEIFSGNQEFLYTAFFSRDSILLWSLSTYRSRRRQTSALRQSHQYPHIQWIEFCKPGEADRFLNALEKAR